MLIFLIFILKFLKSCRFRAVEYPAQENKRIQVLLSQTHKPEGRISTRVESGDGSLRTRLIASQKPPDRLLSPDVLSCSNPRGQQPVQKSVPVCMLCMQVAVPCVLETLDVRTVSYMVVDHSSAAYNAVPVHLLHRRHRLLRMMAQRSLRSLDPIGGYSPKVDDVDIACTPADRAGRKAADRTGHS